MSTRPPKEYSVSHLTEKFIWPKRSFDRKSESLKENEKKKSRICKKSSCFVDSCVRGWAIKPNFLIQSRNMGFVQHIKEIFFVENGGQRSSQEENEKKN
jgi:hypothetical protein